jgi:hypothetical protein
MSALSQLLGQHLADAIDLALATKAAEIAGARLYNGKDAIAAFNLTRTDLTHIDETWLPGRTTPRYSAKAILAYIDRKTTPSRKSS